MRLCTGCQYLDMDIEFISTTDRFVTYKCKNMNKDIYRRLITEDDMIEIGMCPAPQECKFANEQ